MKKVSLLRKIGEKSAQMAVEPRCYPRIAYQPRVPSQLKAQMKNAK
ncbi:hypothetical protein LJC63_09090 [Ruminococcaceae bacterium OttesenSCG-928-L11]|nr:hypothetical protein [Ruminococcaceae bacterium OttesenSCG-928-L11]